jgi:hypothetical protein
MIVSVFGPLVLVSFALLLFGPSLLEVSRDRTPHTTHARDSDARGGRRRLR